MEEVLLIEGNGPLDYVELRIPGGHLCRVYLWGATVFSWTANGTEMLFLSDDAFLDGVKPIRGGIPVVFPQFAQPDLTMPQHGFARISSWRYMGSRVSNASATALLMLCDNEETRKLWPHAFTLFYEVELTPAGLATRLHILNTGSAAFSCQALLHTYLRLPSIHGLTVEGFNGMTYVDKVANSAVAVEDRQLVTIAGEVDRVYLRTSPSAQTPATVMLSDNRVARLAVISNASEGVLPEGWSKPSDEAEAADAMSQIHAHSRSAEQLNVDLVLWNAWEARSKALVDLQDSAYLTYVCVEPGLVSTPVQVRTGHRLTLQQLLQPQ